MLDINNTLDLVKLKLYNEYLYTAHVYAEGESFYHKEVTKKVVDDFVLPLNLPKDSKIIDVGCGVGYFLDEMASHGYTDLTGITLSEEDIIACSSKGHVTQQLDISFLHQTKGYYDESVDFIFCRHALEHSPYPIFTLMEYNRVLKQGSKLYIEVPAPNCDRNHEFNPNHYSILGDRQLQALLVRCGFDVDKFNHLNFVLNIGDKEVEEKFYCIVATKTRPLDLK